MKKTLFLITVLLVSHVNQAQVDKNSELHKILKTNDSIIFNASFNTCNLEELALLINDDFEFYHDKAGLLEGKDTFIENTKNGLCKSVATIRRALETGSLEVYPLKDNNGKLYAAIQQGIHSFYENDKKGSVAKFTHLWVLEEDTWKLKRVLSYDHQDGDQKVSIDKKAITMSANVLMTYAGNYKAPKTGTITVLMKSNSLLIKMRTGQMTVFPKSGTTFFTKEQRLSFEFVKEKNGEVRKLRVIEDGKVIEEALKVE